MFFFKVSEKIITYFLQNIFLCRTSIPFTWYAKYPFTANIAEVACKNTIFQILGLTFFENLFFENSPSFFFCIGCQPLLFDMWLIILLLKMEEQAFLCIYISFQKLSLKFLKITFLKILLLVLVEDAKLFPLICILLF